MKVHKGDKVKVITGKDKGKVGEVLHTIPEKNLIVVKDVNVVKRHVKPGVVSKEGGIVSIEKAIDASNVLVVSPKTGEPSRIGYKIVEGKKVRVLKKGDEVLQSKKSK